MADGTRSDRRAKSPSEPNVMPMIDIMLVLLIIFMITQPLSRMAMDVQVPPPGDRRPSRRRSRTRSCSSCGDDGRLRDQPPAGPQGPAGHPDPRDLRRPAGQAAVHQAGPEPDLPGRDRGDGHRAGRRSAGHRVHAEGSVPARRQQSGRQARKRRRRGTAGRRVVSGLSPASSFLPPRAASCAPSPLTLSSSALTAMTPSPADRFDLDLPDRSRRRREPRSALAVAVLLHVVVIWCWCSGAAPELWAPTPAAGAPGDRRAVAAGGWRRWQAADARLYFAAGARQLPSPVPARTRHTATVRRPAAASSRRRAPESPSAAAPADTVVAIGRCSAARERARALAAGQVAAPVAGRARAPGPGPGPGRRRR